MGSRIIPLNERIIFALDVGSSELAKEWVNRLESHIRFYKVGLQLFLAAGFDIVEWIAARGHRVMVDLKFFDIPETVHLAVKQLQGRNVSFATVHGNASIVEAAAAAKGDVKILAVTVLTSFGQEDIAELVGASRDIGEIVFQRSCRAVKAGCDGVVCSGLEAGRIRSELGDLPLIVTPGIRPEANHSLSRDDQKRVVTARRALAAGADHVVVGRPISKASHPLSVVERLQREIVDALGIPGSRAIQSVEEDR